jgi:hypothetical protein
MTNVNDNTDARRGASPRARRGVRPGSAATLLLCATVLGACEGDNLFQGGDLTGPPQVQILSAPGSVQPGQAVDIEVGAVGTEGIDQISIKLSGGVDMDTTLTITPAVTSVRQIVRMTLPTLVYDTLLQITASARDQAGERVESSQVVPFVVGPPVVSLVAPLSTWAGALMQVEVNAHAMRMVSEIRVELRGAVVLDTTVALSPQVNVTEYVAIRLPGEVTSGPAGTVPQIQVRAFAMDKNGVLSASGVSSVSVQSSVSQDDAPVINYVDPYFHTVVAGHFFDARLSASGSRPIKQIVTRWRGFTADSLNGKAFAPHDTFDIAPARLTVVEDLSVEVPCVAVDATLRLFVTVRDEAEALSAVDSTVTVAVTGNPDCVSVPASAGTVIAGSTLAGFFGSRPAFLASKPFRQFVAGRRRRARIA